MKIVVFLFLSAVVCELTYAAYLDDFRVTDLAIRSISDKFKKALENLKEIIKSGNATIGIPILDPFYLAHKEINAVNNIFTGTIAVANFNFDGLSTYIVRNADFKIAKWNITVDFLWPNVKGKTAYDVQGHALDKILVYGSGDL
ncbi:PREDICTED: uncharacterized protein LOC105367242 [Ceratosolen solmsi marchali]|uniref:Uncharacterized protein LOC105367242 n=1 Tax=Ceratosolen solmsi marchali TaxID=326594 RepID=A0AAJ6YTQ7_9HYME|nr:PREDICTED: uncharacterized protein LOC105367242 [Ceratosolen solmsi marchali]